MREAWSLALAPLLALAFLAIGSSPANAFGPEVLGFGGQCGASATIHKLALIGS